MKSLVTKSEVKTWLDCYPEYKFRSMSYNRRIQEILPPDEKGYALAAQYLIDNGYVSKETVREGQVFCRGQWYSVK